MENGKTILVVEDEKALLNVICSRLSKFGFNVLTATSVEEGMKINSEWKNIDAIWLDHYLPNGKTGLDFVAYLFKSGGVRIPIFIVTNSEDPAHQKEYAETGMVKGYYLKPNYRLDEIIQQIINHLSASQASEK